MGNYTYQATLAASERVNWQLEDVIGSDQQLTSHVHSCPTRSPAWSPSIFLLQKKSLLQSDSRPRIPCMFGIVEEFIVPYVLDLSG